MNRRNFLSSLATAVAGFTILPPATTYARVWRVARPVTQAVIPFWVETHRLDVYYSEVYLAAMKAMLRDNQSKPEQKAFVRTFFFNESCPRD